MSEEDHSTLKGLPSALVTLEEAINDLTTELGGEAFQDMPEVKGKIFK